MRGGNGLKKNGNDGFVMAEVLMTVMLLMVIGTLLFSSASRRYARAERNAAKTEARLAAETAVQVLAEKILREETSDIVEKLVSERGLPRTGGVIWADNAAEKSEKIETTVTSFWNTDGSGLVLQAECAVRNQKESASIVLKRERLSVYTPSNAEREEEDEP